MAAIRMTGMASGLPPNIVETIMDAERIPLRQMESKKADEDSKLQLVTDLETKVNAITGKLGELVGTRGFTNSKLISGDKDIVDGSVDPEKMVTGDYQIEVMRLAQKPGAITNGFPDKNKTQLGVGYLRLDTPDGRKEVYLNPSNNTLEGAAAAINASSLGIRAQVLEDHKTPENPFRLLVSGLASGNENQVIFPTIYMLDGDRDVYFDETRPAQNALIKVDGFEMEIPENKVEDLIPGVSLDLKQAAPGKPINLSVKEDYEVISGKIKEFVDAYNAALGFIQGQHKMQKDKSGKEKLGPLGGDSLVRTVESNLRRVIMNPQMAVDSPIRRISELGIEFNRNGTLNFSQEKFNKVLAANPKGVSAFLRGDGFATGFIPTVRREISNLTNGMNGPLGNRKRGITDKIKGIDRRIDMKERQLEKREDQLRAKFSDLESKMSGINAQGAAVSGLGAAVKG